MKTKPSEAPRKAMLPAAARARWLSVAPGPSRRLSARRERNESGAEYRERECAGNVQAVVFHQPLLPLVSPALSTKNLQQVPAE